MKKERTNSMKKKPGYMLVVIFSFLSLMAAIVMLLFYSVQSYKTRASLIAAKGKSMTFLSSCIAVVNATLLEKEEKQNNAEEVPQKNIDMKQVEWNNLFHLLNQKKSLSFLLQNKEQIEVNFLISAEDGKININHLYDFKNKQFYKDARGDRKVFCKWLFEAIGKKLKVEGLFESFESFVKTKKNPFYDVRELLEIKEFLKAFSERIVMTSEVSENELYLLDLFTVHTNSLFVNPALMSSSLSTVCGIKRKVKNDGKQDSMQNQKENSMKNVIDALYKNYGKTVKWETIWPQTLKFVYEKEFSEIPKEFSSLFASFLNIPILSVVMQITIEEVKKVMYAILNVSSQKDIISYKMVQVYFF